MARTFSTIKIDTVTLERLRRVVETTGELQYRLLDRLLATEEERIANRDKLLAVVRRGRREEVEELTDKLLNDADVTLDRLRLLPPDPDADPVRAAVVRLVE